MISRNTVKFVKSLELKKNRKRERLFVAEGPKVVGDLLSAGFRPRDVFSVTDRPDATLVSAEELARISFLQHPQEVLALFEIPDSSQQPLAIESVQGRLLLALDGVQDPGNVGTIIRIADWFGIDTIVCSMETADAYSPKVVQATMGSIAHVHIIYSSLLEFLQNLPAGFPVYGTLLDGSDIYRQPLSAEGVIVMGNEGNGISEAVRSMVSRRLLIPNFNSSGNTAESLNVAIATAVVCSEFRRRG